MKYALSWSTKVNQTKSEIKLNTILIQEIKCILPCNNKSFYFEVKVIKRKKKWQKKLLLD